MKKEISETKKILLFAVLSAVFGSLTVAIGELILPLAAASLAALFVCEEKKTKSVSTVISALLLLINIAGFFLVPGFVSFTGVATVLFAVTVYLCYTRGTRKSVCAGILITIYSLVLLLTLAVLAAQKIDGVSLDAIVGYYTDLYANVCDSFIAYFSAAIDQITASGGEVAFTAEDAMVMLDAFAKMLVSFVVIVGFALAGITHKFFTAFVLRSSNEQQKILSWRFSTTNVFAYFFLIIFFVSVFFSSYDTLISVVIGNLTTIFTVVYAYLGFNTALAFFSRKRSPVVPFIMLSIGIILFSSFAVELLAVVGVFDVIKKNRTDTYKV